MSILSSSLIGLFGVVISAQAQGPPLAPPPTAERAAAETSRRAVCFRGKPLASCRAFAVTELDFHLQGDPDGGGAGAFLSWNLGAMLNVTDSDALGGMLTLVALENDRGDIGRGAASLRYRRWVDSNVGFDLALGVGGSSAEDAGSPRLYGSAGLSIGDLIGGFGHAVDTPIGVRASGGARFGSWLGLALGAAGFWLYATHPLD
jgi:hypothetical protein